MAPLDTAVVSHWLAIEGVQPAIPENPSPEALQKLSALSSDNRKTEAKEDGVPVDIKLPIKHVLSRELQLYVEKITELAVSRSESPLFKEALVSISYFLKKPWQLTQGFILWFLTLHFS